MWKFFLCGLSFLCLVNYGNAYSELPFDSDLASTFWSLQPGPRAHIQRQMAKLTPFRRSGANQETKGSWARGVHLMCQNWQWIKLTFRPQNVSCHIHVCVCILHFCLFPATQALSFEGGTRGRQVQYSRCVGGQVQRAQLHVKVMDTCPICLLCFSRFCISLSLFLPDHALSLSFSTCSQPKKILSLGIFLKEKTIWQKSSNMWRSEVVECEEFMGRFTLFLSSVHVWAPFPRQLIRRISPFADRRAFHQNHCPWQCQVGWGQVIWRMTDVSWSGHDAKCPGPIFTEHDFWDGGGDGFLWIHERQEIEAQLSSSSCSEWVVALMGLVLGLHFVTCIKSRVGWVKITYHHPKSVTPSPPADVFWACLYPKQMGFIMLIIIIIISCLCFFCHFPSLLLDPAITSFDRSSRMKEEDGLGMDIHSVFLLPRLNWYLISIIIPQAAVPGWSTNDRASLAALTLAVNFLFEILSIKLCFRLWHLTVDLNRPKSRKVFLVSADFESSSSCYFCQALKKFEALKICLIDSCDLNWTQKWKKRTILPDKRVWQFVKGVTRQSL